MLPHVGRTAAAAAAAAAADAEAAASRVISSHLH